MDLKRAGVLLEKINKLYDSMRMAPDDISAVEADPPPAPAGEDEEVEVLFEKPPARELAEKLQELPIQDLRRAMGINERIFTINELFGGDQNAFDATVDRLNRFASFEQAKAYLIKEVAVPFGWTDPQKKEIAKNFIRLVRRLYADK